MNSKSGFSDPRPPGRPRRMGLALAVSGQGVTAVQVVRAAGRPARLQTAELAFADEIALDHPEQAGKALKETLRQQGITASRCVVGLAAALTAAREKTLPATDGESLRSILSIAAEREFAAGPQELALDYLPSQGEQGISALMLAAPRRVVDQVLAMARSAGLAVSAITSSPVAVAMATRGEVGPAGRLVLCLLDRGAELTVQSAQAAKGVRHLPVQASAGNGAIESLAGELRRVLAMMPAQTDGQTPRELLVWDAAGVGATALNSLAERLALPVRVCRADQDLDLADVGATAGQDRFVQAAALACGADQPAIDFLHSRLAPPSRRRFGRRSQWAVAAAAVGLAIIGLAIWDHQARQNELATLQAKIDSLKHEAQQAGKLVDDASFARTYYDRRLEFMDCLNELTSAFPQEGRVWATSVMVREDMQAMLTGKAVNESAVLDVLDRLKANSKLTAVKPMYIRQAGGASKDVSFAIGLSLRRGT